MIVNVNRGDLYYAELGEDMEKGSEQTGTRPVVILQNNTGNEFSPTVIIAPITSKIDSKALMPTHIYIRENDNRLKQNSIILLEQIRVIDKVRIKEFIGTLTPKEMLSVEKAILVSLGIDTHILKYRANRNYNISKFVNTEQKYNKEQSKAYALIAFYNWKNSANKNDRSLRNFDIFLDPVYKVYSKENVIKEKNNLMKKY